MGSLGYSDQRTVDFSQFKCLVVLLRLRHRGSVVLLARQQHGRRIDIAYQ